MLPSPNEGKRLEIEVNGLSVKRYPIKTKVVVNGDNIVQIVSESVMPLINLVQKDSDSAKLNLAVVVGEKAVAASQGRAIPIGEIKPSKLATFLSSHVTKTKAGIGLGIPETMQMAINEIGTFRVLVAFLAAAFTKPFGIKGMFYIVAGPKARSIDGPTSGTLPPYNTMTVLAPSNPDQVAKDISAALNGIGVVIIDANDIGQNILGSANISDLSFIKGAFKDNPLGQGHEQTPVALLNW